MHKLLINHGKMPHFTLIILMVLALLILIITAITSCASRSWQVKSQLNNPTQIEAYEHYLYFLDNNSIKMYDQGEIYDLTAWLPEKQTIRKSKVGAAGTYTSIEDFTIVSPLQLAILSHSLGEAAVVQESTLNLINVQNKEIKKIFSKKDNYNSLAMDQKDNFYLSSPTQVLRITPAGRENVVFDSKNLPFNQRQQDAYFSKISVGKNDHLFVVFEKRNQADFRRIVFELNGNGDIVNTYNPQDILKSQHPWISVLKYEDNAVFLNDTGKLYKYSPGIGKLKLLFDIAIDEIHYWVVEDLVERDNGEYVLLVTDSDTGNYREVWKLLKFDRPVANFISTEVTREEN